MGNVVVLLIANACVMHCSEVILIPVSVLTLLFYSGVSCLPFCLIQTYTLVNLIVV